MEKISENVIEVSEDRCSRICEIKGVFIVKKVLGPDVGREDGAKLFLQ